MMKRASCTEIRSLFFALFVCGFLSTSTCVATLLNAPSVEYSDVVATIDSASDGDTVILPQGTATWNSSLNIEKAIKLQGSGTEVGAGTIIRDSFQINKPLMRWTLIPGKRSRMTNIRFEDAGRVTEADNGIIIIDAGPGSNLDFNRSMRVDHCTFYRLNGNSLQMLNMIGVIDHNFFFAGGRTQMMYGRHGEWDNEEYGDGSWSAPSDFNSDRFLFVETNTFVGDEGSSYTVNDGSSGMRMIFRHNTVGPGGDANFEVHGTDSGNRRRGTRCFVASHNTFIGDKTAGIVGNIRSGVALVHDNIIQNYSTPRFSLSAHRLHNAFQTFGGADGKNEYDVNESGGPFAQGTVSTAGDRTLTVAGSPWTLNQWVNYTVNRVTPNESGAQFGFIYESTANSLTWAPNLFSGDLHFQPGENFEIFKVIHVLDMPGRSRGGLLTGNPPVLPLGWNNQITEPCREWNNIADGTENVNFKVARDDGTIKAGIHYLTDSPLPGYVQYTYPHPLTLDDNPFTSTSPSTTPTTTTTISDPTKPEISLTPHNSYFSHLIIGVVCLTMSNFC